MEMNLKLAIVGGLVVTLAINGYPLYNKQINNKKQKENY